MECGPHTLDPWGDHVFIPLPPYTDVEVGITAYCFMGVLDYAMELQICDS
jgi:hypothetical protein